MLVTVVLCSYRLHGGKHGGKLARRYRLTMYFRSRPDLRPDRPRIQPGPRVTNSPPQLASAVPTPALALSYGSDSYIQLDAEQPAATLAAAYSYDADAYGSIELPSDV